MLPLDWVDSNTTHSTHSMIPTTCGTLLATPGSTLHVVLPTPELVWDCTTCSACSSWSGILTTHSNYSPQARPGCVPYTAPAPADQHCMHHCSQPDWRWYHMQHSPDQPGRQYIQHAFMTSRREEGGRGWGRHYMQHSPGSATTGAMCSTNLSWLQALDPAVGGVGESLKASCGPWIRLVPCI